MLHRTLLVAALTGSLTLALAGCRAEAPLVLTSAHAEGGPGAPVETLARRTRAAAAAVLASLTEDQRAQAVRPIDHELRADWHFIPRQRQGVTLGELDAQQKTLVHQLLQTALSDAGYLKAAGIIWLETVLYDMSNQNPVRDPGKYALLIFGDPADETAAWGWRLEGHHLSINLTYTAEGIGVTPLFFGANPAVVPQGPLAGTRILSDAHDLAVQLAQSMSDAQRAKMMLADKPRDVITGPGREASLREPAGIHVSEMTEDQYTLFLYLISSFDHSIDGQHQLVHLEQIIEADRLDSVLDIHFGWAGPIDADRAFYYRLQSPLRLIEYSCQGPNHVHSVVHDLTDPLQEDLLRRHFEQHHHGDE